MVRDGQLRAETRGGLDPSPPCVQSHERSSVTDAEPPGARRRSRPSPSSRIVGERRDATDARAAPLRLVIRGMEPSDANATAVRGGRDRDPAARVDREPVEGAEPLVASWRIFTRPFCAAPGVMTTPPAPAPDPDSATTSTLSFSGRTTPPSLVASTATLSATAVTFSASIVSEWPESLPMNVAPWTLAPPARERARAPTRRRPRRQNLRLGLDERRLLHRQAAGEPTLASTSEVEASVIVASVAFATDGTCDANDDRVRR